MKHKDLTASSWLCSSVVKVEVGSSIPHRASWAGVGLHDHLGSPLAREP